MNQGIMSWTAIVVAVLIALTEFMAWSGNLNYLWALLVLVWGFMSMSHKCGMPMKKM